MPKALTMEAAERFCSLAARTAGAVLYGSSPQVAIWLLLEYDRPWRRKAVTDNDLPAQVQVHLADALGAIPHARLILIRRDRDMGQPGAPRFYLARADPPEAVLYRFNLNHYLALCDLDLPALARGASQYDSFRVPGSLYAVCTNGQRDACCGRFGAETYQALAALAPAATWRCTHLSGHRFAPTLVALPQGIVYGRVTPEQLPALRQAHEGGDIYLPCLRGQSRYPAAVQAADYFVRRESGRWELDAFMFLTEQPAGDGAREVVFTARDGARYVVRLEQSQSRPLAPSCGAEPAPAVQFRLLNYQVRRAGQALADR